MKQNYYDILEINQNASPEIVEKAYKTLAKKYHPDLQENSLKKDSEEKLKKINEAYEVLSDPQKRESYDASLNMQKMESEKLTEELLNQNKILKNELKNIQNNSNTANSQNSVYNSQTDLRYEQELEMAKQKAYHDAYIQDLKNRGYKIKYKKTWKDYFKNLVALLITVGVLFLLWQIPFVQNIFKNNIVLQTIYKLFE